MSGFDDPAFFGERWAEVYDGGRDLDPVPAVDFLAAMAGGGRVLELAIGTGRVRLPLADPNPWRQKPDPGRSIERRTQGVRSSGTCSSWIWLLALHRLPAGGVADRSCASVH
jgi:hypothetical protein